MLLAMAGTLPMPGRPAPTTRWWLVVAWLVCLAVLATVVATLVMRAGPPRQSPSTPASPPGQTTEPALQNATGEFTPLDWPSRDEPPPGDAPGGVSDTATPPAAADAGVGGMGGAGGAGGMGGGAEPEPEPVATAGGAGGVAEEEEAEAPPPVRCGERLCGEGQVCCNASCGICAAPGAKCDQQMCNVPYVPSSTNCGINTCNVGYVCCNPSCGTCTLPGESCDQRPCMNPVQNPFSEQCGMNTCNVGYVCCNPSCSICKRPGEPCSHEICD